MRPMNGDRLAQGEHRVTDSHNLTVSSNSLFTPTASAPKHRNEPALQLPCGQPPPRADL